MGKKRGGKNRFKPSINDGNELEDIPTSPKSLENSVIEDNYDISCQLTSSSDYHDVADYLRVVQPVLQSVIDDLEKTKQSTNNETSHVKSERNLLLKRVLDTIKEHEVSVMRNQRGSKIFDKIIAILRHIITEELAVPHSQWGMQQNALSDSSKEIEPNESNDDIQEFNVFNALNSVKMLLYKYATDSVTHCTDMYASHCGENLLSLFPLYISFELTLVDGKDYHLTGLDSENVLLYFVNTLREGYNLRHLLFDPRGSHVLRACFLVVNGYVVEKSCKQLYPTKQFIESNQTSLPSTRYTVSQSLYDMFCCIIDDLLTDVSLNVCDYALNAYANPVLQLVFLILTNDAQKFKELGYKFVSIFLPKTIDEAKELEGTLDILLDSPVGSRLIETIIGNASAKHIHGFISFYLNKSNRLTRIATSQFGNYTVQCLLSLPTLDISGLTYIINELNFSEILSAKKSGVIWKLIEAVKRVHGCCNIILNKYLKALGINHPLEDCYPLLWFSIISNSSPNTVQTLFSQTQLSDTTPSEHSESKYNHIHDSKNESGKKLIPDSIGCSILTSFLKFPAASIQPLVESFQFFALPEHLDILHSLSVSRQGSWLIQAIFDPYSPLGEDNQTRLLKVLLPKISSLAFSPYGSFIVSTAYRTVPKEMRRLLLEHLKTFAEKLRLTNIALYRAIDMKQFLENNSQWEIAREKKSKVYEMFQSILEPGSQTTTTQPPIKPSSKATVPTASNRSSSFENSNCDHKKLDSGRTSKKRIISSEAVIPIKSEKDRHKKRQKKLLS